MSAFSFVKELTASGHVRVDSRLEAPHDLDAAVAELDRLARVQLADGAPAVHLPTARWALLMVYRACQALVYRDIDANAVRDVFSHACPVRPSPEVCYSVDLSLRYLPDLLRLARGIAQQDPLVEGLNALAAAWPLSSVGVAGLPELDEKPFIGHPGLLRLYADRIIERKDASRLKHPLVRDAVREALGAFDELSPQIATAVREEKQGVTR